MKDVKRIAMQTTFENHLLRVLGKTDGHEKKESVKKYVTKYADIPVSKLLKQLQDKIKEAMDS